MTKIRIVAAVVDKMALTLYHEDDKTTRIPQGDPRLKRIIDETKDILLAGGVAEVDIDQDDPVTTDFNDFEKSSGGLVRFFKVAKSKVMSLFGTETVSREYHQHLEPLAVGQVPDKTAKMDAALADIMAHAEPATNDRLKSDETMVAVVNNSAPIVGVEKMKRQVAHANKMGSPAALQKFFDRMAAVASKRQHTSQELMNFLEKGDLPIAEDGSIIIYKVLKEKSQHVFVDCHTKKVEQGIGSFVCMDEKLIDPSRRTQCSTGLHVARRGYLGSFSGDVCVLAKVAPEDVIAVPLNEPDKMRVAGYHILFRLTPDMHQGLKKGRPMTEHPEGKKLLAAAIAGQHAAPMEEVRITSAMGGSFTTKPYGLAKTAATMPAPVPLPEVDAIDITDPEKVVAPAVNPTEVAKEIREEKTKMTRAQQVVELVNAMRNKNLVSKARIQAAQDLLDLRKGAKVSWDKLGQPSLTDEGLRSFMTEMGQRSSLNSRPIATKAPTKKAPPKKDPAAKMGPRQFQARKLYDYSNWDALKAHKQLSKISWEKLGFTPQEIAVIKTKIA